MEWTRKTDWSTAKDSAGLIANAEDVIEILYDPPLKSLTQAHVGRLKSKLLDRGLKPSTVNRKLSALSKLLKVAVEHGASVPTLRLKHLKEPQHRIRWFTVEEETAILSWLIENGETDGADFVQLLIETGLRLGEMLALSWDKVFLQPTEGGRPYILVWRSKTSRESKVPLTETAQDILRHRQESADGGLVWPGWDHRRVEDLWNRLRDGLGIDREKDPQFVPHACRHTFCSRLVQRGVPLVTVKELAGHSSIATTMRYSHLAPANLDDGIAKLDIRHRPAEAEVALNMEILASVA